MLTGSVGVEHPERGVYVNPIFHLAHFLRLQDFAEHEAAVSHEIITDVISYACLQHSHPEFRPKDLE